MSASQPFRNLVGYLMQCQNCPVTGYSLWRESQVAAHVADGEGGVVMISRRALTEKRPEEIGRKLEETAKKMKIKNPYTEGKITEGIREMICLLGEDEQRVLY